MLCWTLYVCIAPVATSMLQRLVPLSFSAHYNCQCCVSRDICLKDSSVMFVDWMRCVNGRPYQTRDSNHPHTEVSTVVWTGRRTFLTTSSGPCTTCVQPAHNFTIPVIIRHKYYSYICQKRRPSRCLFEPRGGRTAGIYQSGRRPRVFETMFDGCRAFCI